MFQLFLAIFQRFAVARMFARWAPDYEAEVAQNAYSAAIRVGQAALKHLPAAPAHTLEIADIGIGTGLLAEAVFEGLPCRITGLDFNQDMLTLCSARGIAAALYHCDVGSQKWPIANESMDGVLSAGLFEYLTQDMGAHVIKESFRILKPVCYFIFTYIPEDRKNFKARLWHGHSGRFLTCAYNPAYLERMLKEVGFIVLEHTQSFDGSVFEDGSTYPYRLIIAKKGAV